MKTLDLKRGVQGEFIGSASLINEIVNEDGLDPSLHLDFSAVGQIAYVEGADGPQYQRNIQLLDAVCARASRATNVEWDFTNGGVVGQLTEMEANSVRWNHIAGLFQDGARTNSIRNPRCEGAVAGTPGTLPTNWASPAITEVVGSGYENGWPYVDVRIAAGTGGDVSLVLFESIGTLTASAGQTWTSSVGMKLVGGSLTNITGFQFRAWQYTSAPAFLSIVSGATFTPDAQHRRFSSTMVITGGTTVSVRPEIKLARTSGTIDVTLRIYAPQFELGSTATSPILPPIGSPAASTRATETVTSLTTVTRSSRKSNAGEWDFTNGGAVGAYREFLPNQPAITGEGLLIEEASTNGIRNPRCEGAVAGTPGTAPTNWSNTSNGGGAMRISGSGYENGWPYLEVHCVGTPSGFMVLETDATTQIVAAITQPWTASVGIRLVEGSLTGIPNINLQLMERDASGTILFAAAGLAVPDRQHRRYVHSRTLNQTGVARVQLRLVIGHSSGAIDAKFRFYAPQLEQKVYPTSPVLPPKGAPAAATRAGDTISLARGGWLSEPANGGTIFADFKLTRLPPDSSRAIVSLGPVGSNAIALRQSPRDVLTWDNSVLTGQTVTFPDLNVGEVQRTVAAFATDDVVAAANGQTNQTDTSAVMPTLADIPNLFLGAWGGNVGGLYLSQLRYAPRRTPDAEVATLVGN